MRYLSVCSGIEAASVAWEHLGWTPVGFSEIEPFPSAVLAHRFPTVPNYGDMTKHEGWGLGEGSIDVLVGGTPCQSFSVAGLRRGLHDPRGGLMLTYLEIARRLRPKWVVWENVPGVLSSNRGRDFGSFLGALGDLGYGWAYRVLDAQWVRTHRYPYAVPQRRRRVFVVANLGNWRGAAAVLFERQSVRRDSAARGKKGEGAAADVASSLGSRGVRSHTELDGHGAYIAETREVSLALTARTGKGVNTNLKEGPPLVVYRKAKRAQSVTDNESWVEAAVANTINAFDTGERDTHAVATRAVGVDCYNQSLTGDVAATFSSESGITATRNGPSVLVDTRARDTHAVAFQCSGDRSFPSISVSDIAFCLPSNPMSDRGQAVAIQAGATRENLESGPGGSGVSSSGAAYTLEARAEVQAVAFASNFGTRGGDIYDDGSSPTVRVGSALGIPSPPAVAFSSKDSGADATENVSPTLRAMSHSSSHANGGGQLAVAVGTDCYNGTITGRVAATITRKSSWTPAAGPTVMVAHGLRGEGFDASEDGTERGTPLVTAYSITPTTGQGADLQASEADVASGISAVTLGDSTDRGIRVVAPSDSDGSPDDVRATVRRLTPRECERLQGFPDDWTLIPWRGRPAEDCPDGPRYRALGNSMATNCMEWIGERIARYEAQDKALVAASEVPK